MKPDKLTLSLLFDCYGALLTEKQRECFDLHCNQDLTLAEIAELMGTSRQGVHDAVSRAEAQLLRLEEVTRCLARERRDQKIAAALEALARKVRRALAEREIPFDRKRFSPHITLIRKASGKLPGILLRPASMTVSAVSLMRSDRGKKGMIYTELGAIEAQRLIDA